VVLWQYTHAQHTQIDERQKYESEETHRTHGVADETYVQVKETERAQRQLTADISVLNIEKEQLDEERRELIQQRAKLDLELTDNKLRLEREQKRKVHHHHHHCHAHRHDYVQLLAHSLTHSVGWPVRLILLVIDRIASALTRARYSSTRASARIAQGTNGIPGCASR
jgi:hydroxylamine reductase (hybrid-cluster protein)